MLSFKHTHLFVCIRGKEQVRRRLTGLSSLLPPMRVLGIKLWSPGWVPKSFYPLRHGNNPSVCFFPHPQSIVPPITSRPALSPACPAASSSPPCLSHLTHFLQFSSVSTLPGPQITEKLQPCSKWPEGRPSSHFMGLEI